MDLWHLQMVDFWVAFMPVEEASQEPDSTRNVRFLIGLLKKQDEHAFTLSPTCSGAFKGQESYLTFIFQFTWNLKK